MMIPRFGDAGRSKDTMPRISAFSAIVIAVLLAVPSLAASSRLSEEQLEQLHQEVCSVPPHKGAGGESKVWFCDVPRAYKSKLPDYGNDNDPNYRACPLTFNGFGDSVPTRIFTGRFTEMDPQALIVYRAGCEPHANSYGGVALFKIVDGKFRLVRYYVGIAPVDCVVPAAKEGKLQRPYCVFSFVGQGELSQDFGPMHIDSLGNATWRKLLSAENLDGMFGVSTTECPHPKPAIHDFVALDVDDEGELVVEGRYLSPKGVVRACRRFERGEFSEKEADLREISSVIRSRAFVRDDEEAYLKALWKFDADGKLIVTSFTALAASSSQY